MSQVHFVPARRDDPDDILREKTSALFDRAGLDLVTERAGASLRSLTYPDREPAVQIAYAEALGLGSGTCELVVVE